VMRSPCCGRALDPPLWTVVPHKAPSLSLSLSLSRRGFGTGEYLLWHASAKILQEEERRACQSGLAMEASGMLTSQGEYEKAESRCWRHKALENERDRERQREKFY